VDAQTISKPSVPEFTVAVVRHPFYVESTSQTDPYTGAITTYPGYLEENKSIEITIKNQPFTSVQMADGNWSRLYYSLRFEGHFAVDDWVYFPEPLVMEKNRVNASQSEYTVISLPTWLLSGNQPADRQIDFQVKAYLGYDEARYAQDSTGALFCYGNYFTGESSDWSNSQTLTFQDTPDSTPQNVLPPSTSPTVPNPTESTPLVGIGSLFSDFSLERTIIAVMAVVIVAMLIALVVLWRKVDKKTVTK
jgi:hypothetical protein